MSLTLFWTVGVMLAATSAICLRQAALSSPLRVAMWPSQEATWSWRVERQERAHWWASTNDFNISCVGGEKGRGGGGMYYIQKLKRRSGITWQLSSSGPKFGICEPNSSAAFKIYIARSSHHIFSKLWKPCMTSHTPFGQCQLVYCCSELL